MEQEEENQVVEDGGCINGSGKYMCNSNNNNSNGGGRQTSTRWTPTSEQIRILKELYYNNGVRSPTAEQIQRISARLRQYGKIEGKNVFYWFQNHKARERQKKRFTNSDPPPPPPPTTTIPFYHHNPNNTHHLSHGVPSSSSSHGVHAMGHHVGGYVYGSIAMENSFRECSISPKDDSRKGGNIVHNFGWMGMDPHSSTIPYPFLDQNKNRDEYVTLDHDVDDEEEQESQEIETLPLFPMHGEEIKVYESNGNYNYNYTNTTNGWINDARASLELSLNSYGSGWSMN